MKALLSVILACAAISLSAQTSGELSKTISWQIADSVLTISGQGKMPSYNTTSISKLPWQNERIAAGIKKIVVEEGITEIGSYCFGARSHSRNARDAKEHTYYNTQDATTSALFCNIQEVQLPSTLEKIGSHAFVRMPLTHIHFPAGLREICAGSFSNSDLRVVILPSSLTHLGSEAFGNCLNLQAIDFANLPITVSSGLFFGDERLRLLVHTSKIKDIKPSAFDATLLGDFTPEGLLRSFHTDGMEYFLSVNVPNRQLYTGTDEEYQREINRATAAFYEKEAANATSLFQLDRLELSPYDEDNSTFTIHSVNHGKLLMHVSADIAPLLIRRWARISENVQPVFVPADGRVMLQSVNIPLGTSTLVAAPIEN